MSIKATCNECQFSGSLRELEIHSCYVQQQGGRCEDYPCCGHTDGDGCQTLETHTAEYWMDRMQSLRDMDLTDEEIDEACCGGDW